VEDKAEAGVTLVGDLGALVGGEGDGGVGLAGGEDGETCCGEDGTEAVGEGEGEVFFEEIVWEVGSGIGASVSGVQEDGGAGLRGRRLLGGGGERQQGEEERDDGLEGRSQGLSW
jgi:hypothetical protein